jgi:hypothetical protein
MRSQPPNAATLTHAQAPAGRFTSGNRHILRGEGCARRLSDECSWVRAGELDSNSAWRCGACDNCLRGTERLKDYAGEAQSKDRTNGLGCPAELVLPGQHTMEAAATLGVLKRFFGYASFRHSQARVIENVLGGRSALLVSATGCPPAVLVPARAFHADPPQLLCGPCHTAKAQQAKPPFGFCRPKGRRGRPARLPARSLRLLLAVH